ncbi:MAG: PadR family transcriptional regulator [Actinobacteria bacterium RBG_19FT_COMBO_54_7]|uniref:PadR family transcriptional regulator n=1 Tax=Candidatus Solincola sediminis TaxID=1797199 RepID=A0A1F2WRI3_9ACTN|nr:MAG: PadR family transcriptional regulator [Candidatus Solincola sediminis]OFW59921.1 MAG: PadR family transcriptional regulator [Candidatus Solincola sediminis]OFW70258.1 MAG: PadR family transcriptional regulator [Actinobacteria bacterium RBG_19FT_COMBO_54_7]
MKLQRDLFLGFVKIHILYHASQEEVSGVWLSTELKRHGYAISPGTLYPTLRKLEKDSYLTSSGRVEQGHRRIYYRTTARGKKALEKARHQAHELIDEIEEWE